MEGEHELIAELIKAQDEKRAIQIIGIQKNMEAGFDLLAVEMSKITEQKKVQNGRVDKLESITKINKFINDRPRLSVIVGIVGYYGVSEMLSIVSIVDVVKKYLP